MQAEAPEPGRMPYASEPASAAGDRVPEVLIAALQRRADAHQGEVAQLLQARLVDLTQQRPAGDRASTGAIGTATAQPTSPSPLGELLHYLQTTKRAARSAQIDSSMPTTSPSAVLAGFQQLWRRIRTDSQVRRSMAAVPEDAGPLHSSALLHRALTVMQEASPGYLQHFIAYVDALSWMEQLQGGGVLESPKPPGGRSVRTASKPRVRNRPAPASKPSPT